MSRLWILYNMANHFSKTFGTAGWKPKFITFANPQHIAVSLSSILLNSTILHTRLNSLTGNLGVSGIDAVSFVITLKGLHFASVKRMYFQHISRAYLINPKQECLCRIATTMNCTLLSHWFDRCKTPPTFPLAPIDFEYLTLLQVYTFLWWRLHTALETIGWST